MRLSLTRAYSGSVTETTTSNNNNNNNIENSENDSTCFNKKDNVDTNYNINSNDKFVNPTRIKRVTNFILHPFTRVFSVILSPFSFATEGQKLEKDDSFQIVFAEKDDDFTREMKEKGGLEVTSPTGGLRRVSFHDLPKASFNINDLMKNQYN
eukprot:Pgem_evm1s5216